MRNNQVVLFLTGVLCLLTASCQKPNEENGDGGNSGGKTLELKVECKTLEVTDLEHSSVKLNGSATISNAKSEVANAYFYYSATASDATTLKNSTKVNAGEISSKGGSYSALLNGLEPSTRYYYIAGVSIDGKEFLGDTKSFTTKEPPKDMAITGDASSITEKSVTLSGSVNPTSDMQDVLMGVLYSLNSSPNIENSTKVQAKDINNNAFTIALDDLPSSTMYYYKTYIQYNGAQYRFGEVKSFTTETVSAAVSSISATNISEFKGTLNGKLEVNSKATLTQEVGFLFSSTETTLDALKERGERLTCQLSNDGQFMSELSELTPGTKYYYTAVAQVYDKMFYGEVISFSTESIKATVTTEPATDISEFKASLNGKLSIDSQESFSKSVWFLFSDKSQSLDELKVDGKKIASSLSNDGSFNADVTSLSYNTQYYYVAVAKVQDQEFYGDPQSFKTLDISADISTEAVSNILFYSASFNGKLTNISLPGASISVGFYYSDVESSIEGLVSKGSQGHTYLEGETFSIPISGLKAESTYYCVAFASVGGKLFYGDIISFDTRPIEIDLGLSVNWAAINVGAYYRCDPGEPYSWGETSIKSKYNWSKYQWGKTSTSLTKYNTLESNGTVDNLIQLEPNDDVANVVMGNGWRMPTIDELKELLTQCTWTWEWLAEDEHGIYGYTIVGPNGNSIFMPVAGGVNGDYKKTNYNTGCYWSSSLDTEHPESAKGLLFSNTQHYPTSINRFMGYAVRAVKSK